MVQRVETYQTIQYSIHDNKHWLYNVQNDRMIVSKQPLEKYLKGANQMSSPLYDFYHSPYKRGKLSNFHIFRIVLDSSKILYFNKVMLSLLNSYLTISMLILCIMHLSHLAPRQQNSAVQFNLSQFSIAELVTIYLAMVLIILPLHEYAHFSVYYKYFKPPKVTFGFSIRYFSMPVFFIKVPFYKLLPSKEKNELILAGIKFQVVLWFLLDIIHLIYPSTFVTGLIVMNIGLIVTNLLPFLKLDGYWYLSNILKVDDYMNYFKRMFLKEVAPRLDILILGIINCVLIALSILGVAYDIFTLFI